jgi:hypothetical protein
VDDLHVAMDTAFQVLSQSSCHYVLIQHKRGDGILLLAHEFTLHDPYMVTDWCDNCREVPMSQIDQYDNCKIPTYMSTNWYNDYPFTTTPYMRRG